MLNCGSPNFADIHSAAKQLGFVPRTRLASKARSQLALARCYTSRSSIFPLRRQSAKKKKTITTSFKRVYRSRSRRLNCGKGLESIGSPSCFTAGCRVPSKRTFSPPKNKFAAVGRSFLPLACSAKSLQLGSTSESSLALQCGEGRRQCACAGASPRGGTIMRDEQKVI